jgi:hypothetical protein
MLTPGLIVITGVIAKGVQDAFKIVPVLESNVLLDQRNAAPLFPF